MATEFDVLAGYSRHRRIGSVVAEYLLHRGFAEFRMPAQVLELLGVTGQVVHAGGKQVAGGFMTSEQQQHAGGDQFLLVQHLTLVLGADQIGDHVGARPAATVGDQFAKGAGQIRHGRFGALVLVRRDARTADEQAEVVGPQLEGFDLAARRAQHFHDHRRGNPVGDLADEIDCIAPGHRVEGLVDDLGDARRHRVHRARGEAAIEQTAQAGVVGRIEKHCPQAHGSLEFPELRALLGRQRIEEGLHPRRGKPLVEQDCLAVLVARHHPAAQRRAPVHRRLALQAREQREGIVDHRSGAGVVTEVAGSHHGLARMIGADRAAAERIAAAAFNRYPDPAAPALKDMMRKTLGIKLTGDPVKAVAKLAVRYLLSETERSGVLRSLISEGDLTGFGLVNAITGYAQEIAEYDRSTELEAIGGKMLEQSAKEWAELTEAA